MKTITDQNFKEEILGSDELVIVDFWAEWCEPCKKMFLVLKELGTKVKIYKMNVEDNPSTPAMLGILSLPTIKFFKGGEVVGDVVGSTSKQRLEDIINSLS